MPCVEMSSEMAAPAPAVEAESSLTRMSLEPLALGSLSRVAREFSIERTQAITVVEGRSKREDVRPFPIPLLAPVMRYIEFSVDIMSW